MNTATTQRPETGTGTDAQLEDFYQVVLFNDDHNTFDHVIRSLMRVFGHAETLAAKLALEAHARGKTIAEVEGETPARLHRDQLQSFGLTATVEKL
jgi:ATP-dependent Clp protease adaptor protein ClpS